MQKNDSVLMRELLSPQSPSKSLNKIYLQKELKFIFKNLFFPQNERKRLDIRVTFVSFLKCISKADHKGHNKIP